MKMNGGLVGGVTALVLTLFGSAAVVDAVIIDSAAYTWTGTEPTQTGRTFRDGIQSTWAAPKSYPGTFDLAPHAHVLFGPVNVGSTNFLEITFTSDSLNEFVVGYHDSFDPSNIGTNYLGDPGASAQIRTFQVTLAPDGNFLLNVEFVPVGAASGSFSYRVDAFLDANRTEPVGAVPEPTTLLLLGGGMIGLAWRRLRKR